MTGENLSSLPRVSRKELSPPPQVLEEKLSSPSPVPKEEATSPPKISNEELSSTPEIPAQELSKPPEVSPSPETLAPAPTHERVSAVLHNFLFHVVCLADGSTTELEVSLSQLSTLLL